MSGLSEQQPAAVAVGEISRVHAAEQHQPGRVHEQVPLAALQPLGPIVAARRTSTLGGPDG